MRYFSDFLIRSAGGTIPADIRTGRDVNFSLNKISAPPELLFRLISCFPKSSKGVACDAEKGGVVSDAKRQGVWPEDSHQWRSFFNLFLRFRAPLSCYLDIVEGGSV